MKGFLQLFLCLFLFQFVEAQRDCGHGAYEEQTIAANPGLISRFSEIDGFSNIRSKNSAAANRLEVVPQIIRIPVVVHILFNNDEQNISDAQVKSQLDVLNRDFRGINGDRKKVPAHFFSTAADCGIEFQLATKDPAGAPTTGIIRKWTSIQHFSLDDKVKSANSKGDDPWDPKRYLNIWVCSMSGGLLGYSSTPGGPPEKDGIVICYSVFGTTGKHPGAFNLGRTATHEIGHWLNLRHIWGDTYCGDDKVDDTPKQRSPNNGCPSGKRLSCTNDGEGDMYMNFMDLTDDGCMYMFTNGQKVRMRALFEDGAPRHALLSSGGLDTTFNADNTIVISSENPESPSIRPVLKAEIRVFPNPVGNFLSVSITEEGKNTDVKTELFIYNHTGVPVMKEMMSSGSKTFSISQLKPGLYYLHIIEGEKRSIRKFLKL